MPPQIMLCSRLHTLPCLYQFSGVGSWHELSDITTVVRLFSPLKKKVALASNIYLEYISSTKPTEPLKALCAYQVLICYLHTAVRQVLRISPQPSSNKSTSVTAAIVYFSLMNANIANSTERNTNKNAACLQIQSFLLCQIHHCGESRDAGCILLS